MSMAQWMNRLVGAAGNHTRDCNWNTYMMFTWRPAQVPPELTGVTPKMLEQLWHLAGLGKPNAVEGVVRYTRGLLSVSRSLRPDNYSLLLARGNRTAQGVYVIPFADDPNDNLVYWDRTITVADAQKLLERHHGGQEHEGT